MNFNQFKAVIDWDTIAVGFDCIGHLGDLNQSSQRAACKVCTLEVDSNNFRIMSQVRLTQRSKSLRKIIHACQGDFSTALKSSRRVIVGCSSPRFPHQDPL